MIPFSITNVTTADWSMGHRFLGGKWQLTEPAKDYEECHVRTKCDCRSSQTEKYDCRTIEKTRRSKELGHSSG